MRGFVGRDLDGFFGLFLDNFVQILLIIGLCSLCGMVKENAFYIYQYILPGVGLSVIAGNLFYSWQARQLMSRENRDDVTALPYGINTPSVVVFVLFVMAPLYAQSGSVAKAWQMGLLACLGSGLIEFGGAFVAVSIRRYTPRAALLATLAGIAIAFIALQFALQIWARPLVAMVPLGIVLVTYFSGIRFPLGIPGGLLAVVVGTLLAWLLPTTWTQLQTPLSLAQVQSATQNIHPTLPIWTGGLIWELLQQPEAWLPYLTVIIPMGLFNLIGSLQNIESAAAAGDEYDERTSLAVNGLGTILAACLGSCFPTTIYIGHPGWKGLGARAGYSTLNGFAIVILCLLGLVPVLQALVPMESGIAIVVWIGIVITAQAFQATPSHHAPAVAIGLFPTVASFGALIAKGSFLKLHLAKTDTLSLPTLEDLLKQSQSADVNGFLLHGMIVLDSGFIIACMFIAAISVHLLEKQFLLAGIWSLVGVAATLTGLCHAYHLVGNDWQSLLPWSQPTHGIVYRAYPQAAGYLLMAITFFLIDWLQRTGKLASKDISQVPIP